MTNGFSLKQYYKGLFTHPIQTIRDVIGNSKPATPKINVNQYASPIGPMNVNQYASPIGPMPAANASTLSPITPKTPQQQTTPTITPPQISQVPQAPRKQIYRIGADIYDASTNQRIPDVATLQRDYAGAQEISAPATSQINPATGGITQPVAPSPTTGKKFYRKDGNFYEEGTNRYIDSTEFGTGAGFTEVQVPAAPTPPPTPYEKAEKQYEEALKLTPEEIAIQEQLNRLSESAQKAYIGEGQRAIPLEFITGRQQAIEERALGLQQPLLAKAALLQAKRTGALEASKFRLEQEANKLKKEKPITVAPGATLYDPTTQKGIFTAPAITKTKATQDPDRILTLAEAQALGVPFGTTAGEAYGITPQKPLTETQAKDLTYARRGDEAQKVINDLENIVASYNPATWTALIAMEKTTIGNAYVPDEIRQIRQAERNFVTAVLRRESGAAISASEFSTAEKQYFPRPGDDAKTLAKKAQNRQTAINSFYESAGRPKTTDEGGFAEEW